MTFQELYDTKRIVIDRPASEKIKNLIKEKKVWIEKVQSGYYK